MSLKHFKHTIQFSSSDAAASESEYCLRQLFPSKKPPKGSLKDRIVSLDRLCSTEGKSFNSTVGNSYDPSKEKLEDENASFVNSKRKRKVSEQLFENQLPLVEGYDLCAKREVTDECILRRCSGAEIQLKERSGTFPCSSEGVSVYKTLNLDPSQRNTKDRWEVAGYADGDYEREENDDFLDLGRDSEAGLFIQSEAEGLFEPLVLWPPEGCNDLSEIAHVQVPASINSRLLEHQRQGVKFLYNLYREDKGGVLGDDMGLGKTIQAIAFLAAVLDTGRSSDCVDNNETMESSSKDAFKEMNKICSRNVALIICPTSVIQNWEREFEAWGAFQLGIYHGIQRDSVLEKVHNKALDVLLTSHDTFRIHGDDLSTVGWEVVIVDEAHRLKNEKSQLYKACLKIKTKKRYGLTGTIMQNKLMDLFNVFDWASPGCLGLREHFKEYYDEPIKQGQRISAPEKFVQNAELRRHQLGKVLQKYLLRRTKQETLAHLMRGKEDIVVFCTMSDVQKRAYKRLLQSPDFQCLINKDLPCTCGSSLKRGECCYKTAPNGIIWTYLHRDNQDGCDSCPYCLLLPCLTKLQQVSNHLALLKPNSKDEIEKQKKDAAFALLAFGEDEVLLEGIREHGNFLGLSDAQHCGKMLALEKLLASWISKGDKVLLFSYSVKMLDILNKFLIRKGYNFSRLDGSTPMAGRQSIVDEFNNSPSKQVFLISTRAGGLGLNLVSANRVVIFDPNWNPAHDQQAQDRSFRYGQQRHVLVFRLLAAGSLEELVYTRQIYKQQLFNIAVSGSLEKRYFEGVQDSKVNKGELFGIGNLFRDLSDQIFTSDVINSHEERLTKKAENQRFLKCNKENSLNAEIEENLFSKNFKGNSEGDFSVNEISKVLAEAGVVYAHRNEEVVNVNAHGPKNLLKVIPDKQDARPIGSGDITVNTSHINQKKKASKPPMKASPMPDKSTQFLELAKFKSLTDMEFSRWCLTALPADVEELFHQYQQSGKDVRLKKYL